MNEWVGGTRLSKRLSTASERIDSALRASDLERVTLYRADIREVLHGHEILHRRAQCSWVERNDKAEAEATARRSAEREVGQLTQELGRSLVRVQKHAKRASIAQSWLGLVMLIAIVLALVLGFDLVFRK